jgi:hypothetical protein
LSGITYAATYYVDGSVATDYGNGSLRNPKKYINSGIGLLSGGDTLIVKNGIYTGPANDISNVPSGTPGAYTVIKAQKKSKAIIKGQGTGIDIDGRSYIQIEGFRIRDTSNHAVSVRNSHHIKLICIGVKNGADRDSRYGNVIEFTENSNHCLLEDSWVVGVMRYGVNVYESYNIILRRVVVRFDGNSEREPKTGICFYGQTGYITGSYDCLVQNCIAIDYNRGEALGSGMQNVHSAKNIKYQGCLALNIPSNGFFMNESAGSYGQVYENCIAWDCTIGFPSRHTTDTATTILNQVTAGMNTGRGYDVWGNTYGTSIKNSVFYRNGGNNRYAAVDSYNIYYKSYGTVPDPAENYLTKDPGFKYLCQIETDSPAYQSGEAGVTRGAQMLKRYGVSGTLYGESGYDSLSDEDLWPWPNEDQIRDDFSEPDSFPWYTSMWDGSSSVPNYNNTTRGFCSPGMTLTKYIWGYLGNESPIEEKPLKPDLEINDMKIIGSLEGRGTVNPDCGETVKIYFEGESFGVFECRIFTLAGELVWEDRIGDVDSGMFEWHAEVSSGTYIVHVKGPDLNKTKKVIIIR